jgi:hypothetical protein
VSCRQDKDWTAAGEFEQMASGSQMFRERVSLIVSFDTKSANWS